MTNTAWLYLKKGLKWCGWKSLTSTLCCWSTDTSTAWTSSATTTCWKLSLKGRWPRATKPVSAWRTRPVTMDTTGGMPAPHIPRCQREPLKTEMKMLFLPLMLLTITFYINSGSHDYSCKRVAHRDKRIVTSLQLFSALWAVLASFSFVLVRRPSVSFSGTALDALLQCVSHTL